MFTTIIQGRTALWGARWVHYGHLNTMLPSKSSGRLNIPC